MIGTYESNLRGDLQQKLSVPVKVCGVENFFVVDICKLRIDGKDLSKTLVVEIDLIEALHRHGDTYPGQMLSDDYAEAAERVAAETCSREGYGPEFYQVCKFPTFQRIVTKKP